MAGSTPLRQTCSICAAFVRASLWWSVPAPDRPIRELSGQWRRWQREARLIGGHVEPWGGAESRRHPALAMLPLILREGLEALRTESTCISPYHG